MDFNLKAQSFNSVKWITLGNIAPKLITPLITIGLTRIIKPELYGILSICILINSFAEIIQGFGVIDYIIKEDKISKLSLNTAFIFNIFLSILLYLIIILLSPFIANYFSKKILLSIIPLSSTAILVNAIGSVPYAILIKNMEFKKLFLRQLVPIVANIMITLPLALLGLNIYALILGLLAQIFLTNMLYVIFSRWKPSLSFSLMKCKEIFSFGKWMVLERITEYLYISSDRILLSLIGDLNFLGVYNLASQFITIAIQVIRAPIQNLMFPLLSKVQRFKNLQKNIFLYFLRRITLSNIYGLSLLLPFCYLISCTFLKKEWSLTPTLVSILCIGQCFIQSIGPQRELLKIKNKANIYSLSLIAFLIISSPIYIIMFRWFNPILFCFCKALSDFLMFLMQIFIIQFFLNINLNKFLKQIFAIFFISLLFNLLIYVLSNKVNYNFNNLLFLIFYLVISVFYIPIAYYFLFNKEFKKVVVDIRQITKVKK